MVSWSNGLTPAEAERLALLMEECGEVVQIIGKVLRHGYNSTHPDGGPTNREMLERELGDFRAAFQLMIQERDIDSMSIVAACMDKRERMGQYLHHQDRYTKDSDGSGPTFPTPDWNKPA